jgi:hypothetical protein
MTDGKEHAEIEAELGVIEIKEVADVLVLDVIYNCEFQ